MSSMDAPATTVEIAVDSLESVQEGLAGYRAAWNESAAVMEVRVQLRFELCASLYQGGLTPSNGLVISACHMCHAFNSDNMRSSSVSSPPPVKCRAMLRNRPGTDYEYSACDTAEMLTCLVDWKRLQAQNIHHTHEVLEGVVFGALTTASDNQSPEGNGGEALRRGKKVDTALVNRVLNAMGAADAMFSNSGNDGNVQSVPSLRLMTFHRAVDEFTLEDGSDYEGSSYQQALRDIMNINTVRLMEAKRKQQQAMVEEKKIVQSEPSGAPLIDHILTSGGCLTASRGSRSLRSAVRECQVLAETLGDNGCHHHISIMPGCGVLPSNAGNLIAMDRRASTKDGADDDTDIPVLRRAVHLSAKKMRLANQPLAETCFVVDRDIVKQICIIVGEKILGMMKNKHSEATAVISNAVSDVSHL